MSQASWLKGGGRMRDLALSAGGGSSLGALLGWLAKDFVISSTTSDPWDSLHQVIPVQRASDTWSSGPIHWLSVCLGILIGFFLWPVVELIYLARHWFTLRLRVRYQQLLRGSFGESLYRKLG